MAVSALTSKKLLVGVTADFMLSKKKHREFMEPLAKRCFNVQKSLEIFDKSLELETFHLKDGLGPVDRDFQAIIVSPETVTGGEKVNEKRAELGLGPLEIVQIHFVEDKGHSDKVSSTYLREYLSARISSEDLAGLRKDWDIFAKFCKLEDEPSAVYFWKFIDLYTESWRKYHTLDHLLDLLRKLKQLSGLSPEEEAFMIGLGYP